LIIVERGAPLKAQFCPSSSAFRRSAEAPPCGNGRYLSIIIWPLFCALLKAQFCPSHHEKHKLNQEVYLCFFVYAENPYEKRWAFPPPLYFVFYKPILLQAFLFGLFLLKDSKEVCPCFLFLDNKPNESKATNTCYGCH